MVVDRIRSAATYVEKGGVGKTTSAAHIAVCAAQDHDLDVVLVDLAGTQNDLATQFGLTKELVDVDAPISAVFGTDWSFIEDNIPDILNRMVFETGEGPDLIPADPGLGGADNRLADEPVEVRFRKLDGFITEHLAPAYDLVMFDLPGKEDNIALNGLFAAENIIAPLKPGEFERNQLRKLDETLAEINEGHETSLSLELVFATQVMTGQDLDSEFVAELDDRFPREAGEPIPKSANVGHEQETGQTLFALDDDELYDTGVRAREAYRTNTSKLLDNIN